MKRERVTIPHASLIPAVQMATSRVENASAHEGYLRSRPRDYSPDILYRHIHALTIPATTYIAAQRARRILCEEFAAAFESVKRHRYTGVDPGAHIGRMPPGLCHRRREER